MVEKVFEIGTILYGFINKYTKNQLTFKNCHPETVTVQVVYNKKGYCEQTESYGLPNNCKTQYEIDCSSAKTAYIYIECKDKIHRICFDVIGGDEDDVTFDKNESVFFNGKERSSKPKDSAIEWLNKGYEMLKDKHREQQRESEVFVP